MKILSIILLIANTQMGLVLTEFRDFVSFNYKPSETIRRNCSWQYAIIKVNKDARGVIKDYHIENNVSSELITTFNFLKGYKFSKSIVGNKHHVVFFVSLQNQRVDNCDVIRSSKHQAAEGIFKKYKLQNARDNNFYINEIITTVIYDPVN